MKSLFAAALALAASACAANPAESAPPAPAAGASYRALGTEPFWAITIADGRMSYEAPDGPNFSIPAPEPESTARGRRSYTTQRLTLEITPGECSDGMNDRLYADTVRAVADGRALSGCGGAILPPSGLAGTRWAIVEIAGQAVSGERFAMQFTADRLSGQAGCNRFTGGYALSGETLTAGPIAMTRMACANATDEPGPDPMALEQTATAILSGPVRVSHPDGDTLVLSGSGGAIRLRRVI